MKKATKDFLEEQAIFFGKQIYNRINPEIPVEVGVTIRTAEKIKLTYEKGNNGDPSSFEWEQEVHNGPIHSLQDIDSDGNLVFSGPLPPTPLTIGEKKVLAQEKLQEVAKVLDIGTMLGTMLNLGIATREDLKYWGANTPEEIGQTDHFGEENLPDSVGDDETNL